MVATPSAMLPLGTIAPDFALLDPAGTTHTLSSVADGKAGLLVAFICNHCPYVKHLHRELALLTDRWQHRGLGVVGINPNDADAYPDDSPAAMADEARTVGYTFPYLVDGDQRAATEYHAVCTPDFFLFDDQRRLVYRGQFDDSRPRNDVPVTGKDLKGAVDALLEGRSGPTVQVPSIGCSIKWKPGNEPPW
jgi:peroxiredoxin